MAFIIPNAVDTTSGNKYFALDQAEPDSIDFEILGNGNTGVITGCEVSQTPVQGGSVVVSSGAIILNGVRYSVEANTFLVLPSPPATTRFDLIVARLSGSTMTTVALYGAESSTNPSFPRSKSTMVSTTGVNVLSYFNPDTDVVLASVYRYGSSNVVNAHIADKRRMVQSSITFKGANAPSPTEGQVGDVYLKTGNLNPSDSGLYVKQSASAWVQLGSSSVDPGVPIGTVITWVAPTAPNGGSWLECNGAAVSRALNSGLFAVLGTTYGSGDGVTTFNLPDFRGMYLAGMPSSGGALNTQVGNIGNQVSLNSTNLPSHTHSIDHGHGQTATGEGGDHTHTPGNTSAEFAIKLAGNPPNYYVAPRDKDGYPGYIDGYLIDLVVLANTGPGMTVSSTATTSKATPITHSHAVTVPPSTGLVSGAAGQSSTSPVNIQPRTMYVKYYIRCA